MPRLPTVAIGALQRASSAGRRTYATLSTMMGRDHALSGALVFAGLAPALHVTDAHLAAGIALCAGAGVLPDIDHQDTSVSSSFGFLTEGFSRLVALLSGGHRHGTHSIFGIAVFTAGSYFACLYQLSG